ncbi:hypothetical protein [Maricaulis sp.]|uniref:hypothetical protein n=1 Tax=unclassified Maricaulis TaxID=2632371 RepID=UPI001B03B76A|nr:hypothetical protein [Maricaulis sp.]MBO6798152.1 hypothetical protein [Maricaulis sp.]
MNPGVLFLPVYRASTTAFLLGLLVLAVIDFARMSSGVPFLSDGLGMVAVWFFVLSLHINRLRHSERGMGMAFLPVGLAVVAKFIGWIISIFTFAMQGMVVFAAERGVDVDPDGPLEDALTNPDFVQAMEDPQFVQSFTAWAEEDATMQAAAASVGEMSSFLGFWIVLAVFAIWFSQMKRLGGALPTVSEDTPSMLNPEPMAAPSEPEPLAEPVDAEAVEVAEEAPAEPSEDAAPAEDAATEDTPSDDSAGDDSIVDEKPKD